MRKIRVEVELFHGIDCMGRSHESNETETKD